MMGADSARTNAGPGPRGPGTGAQLWAYELPPGVVPATQAAVADDRLFVVTFQWDEERPGIMKPDGVLWAFDVVTGSPVWRAEVPASRDGPVVSGGLVYVSHMWSLTREQGGVSAWNATTGKPEWSYTFDWIRAHSPSAMGQLVAVPVSSFDGSALIALNATTGEFMWEAPMRTQDSPAAWRNLLFGASHRGDLAAVDAGTGRVAWSADMRGTTHATPVVVGSQVGAVLVQSSGQSPVVVAWEPANGSFRWEYLVNSTELRFVLSAAGDGLLLLMDSFGVTALREHDGQEAWTMPVPGGFLSGMAVGPTHLFLTQDQFGLAGPDEVTHYLSVQAVGLADGSLAWERRLGSHGTLAPTLADGLLFVADETDGVTRLVALDAGLFEEGYFIEASPDAATPASRPAPGLGPVGPAMLLLAAWIEGIRRTREARKEK